MSEAFEAKDWDDALSVYQNARRMFESILSDKAMSEHVESLPRFLRRFTRGAVLAYVLTKGVEVLERKKEYEQVNYVHT